MDDFSLYVLDITMNSVRAGGQNIAIRLEEKGPWLFFSVTDDGCGMTEEQVRNLSDPFFTTRKTRKVGLGVPFLKMLAEGTGGELHISSKSQLDHPDDHGTVLEATFGREHLDFIPLGDLGETVLTLIQGSPNVNFTFDHITGSGTVHLSCEELSAVLGEDISLAEPEILAWIRDFLRESYQSLENK